jgi:Golgi phosphoprotein 3 (GPP34)
VLGVGLAGALLADLAIVGCLDVGGEQVRVGDAGTASDGLGRGVGAAIAAAARPVRWWVECLAASMYPRTGEQLARRAVVTRVPAGLFRTGVRYPAMDALVAAGPRVRLRHEAESIRLVPDPAVAALAALALRTGLGGVVADAANRSAREGLPALARAVPATLRPVTAGVDDAMIRIALTTPRGR